MPEWGLIADFYRLWAGVERAHPTKKELLQAAEIIARHGPAKAKQLIPLLVERLRRQWPEAKTFGAVLRYLPEATEDYERRQRHAEREREEEEREREDRERATRHAQEKAALKALWERLPEAEREDIRRSVLARQPRGLQKYPGLVEGFCLEELARRKRSTADPPG